MASIRKWKRGWRAEVARKGVRRSRVFPTRQEAKDWAARQEFEILNGEKVASETTFSDVLDRYAREVSPSKRGHRWEVIRLEKLRRDRIADKAMRDLGPPDFADWRERRLAEVAPASVKREMALLSSVLSVARREWGLLSVNPMEGVRKPQGPERRVRRPTQNEIDRMALVAGDDLSTLTARAFHAFLFSIETGMRAGEIVGLRAGDVRGRVARLPVTKNGTAREVPLSTEAVRLLDALPEMDPVFGLSSSQLESLFRKVRDKAAVFDLHFHDARHEAITRLSRKLDVLALARMVGHRDVRMLMTYYEETAEDLAKRLE